jgi:hypothetical protein
VTEIANGFKNAQNQSMYGLSENQAATIYNLGKSLENLNNFATNNDNDIDNAKSTGQNAYAAVLEAIRNKMDGDICMNLLGIIQSFTQGNA